MLGVVLCSQTSENDSFGQNKENFSYKHMSEKLNLPSIRHFVFVFLQKNLQIFHPFVEKTKTKIFSVTEIITDLSIKKTNNIISW